MGAILKSQKRSSKSRKCSAISSYTFLTPSWCRQHFTCDQPIIPERLCFHFIEEQSPTAFMAGCSSAKSWWNANFWVDDRLSLIIKTLQTHFINVPKSYLQCGTQRQSWRAATTHINLFLQFNYINSNVSYHEMSDLQFWLSGQSVALNKREIASSDSSGVLLP